MMVLCIKTRNPFYCPILFHFSIILHHTLVFKTTLTELNEFGVGISLYFHTIFHLSILMLVCGLVSIPAIVANADFNPPDLNSSLKGLLGIFLFVSPRTCVAKDDY